MTRPTGVIKMLIDETSPDAKEEEMTKKYDHRVKVDSEEMRYLHKM